MEFIGKIIYVGQLQTGESQKGEWKRFEFVMEEENVQYPQKAAFRVRGTQAETIRQSLTDNGSAGTWKAQYAQDAFSYEKDGEERWVNVNNCWKLERC